MSMRQLFSFRRTQQQSKQQQQQQQQQSDQEQKPTNPNDAKLYEGISRRRFSSTMHAKYNRLEILLETGGTTLVDYDKQATIQDIVEAVCSTLKQENDQQQTAGASTSVPLSSYFALAECNQNEPSRRHLHQPIAKISTLIREGHDTFSLRCAFAPVTDPHRLAAFAAAHPKAVDCLFSQVLSVYVEHGGAAMKVDRGGFVMVDTEHMLSLSTLAIRYQALRLKGHHTGPIKDKTITMLDREMGLASFVPEQLFASFDSSDRKFRRALSAELKKIASITSQACQLRFLTHVAQACTKHFDNYRLPCKVEDTEMEAYTFPTHIKFNPTGASAQATEMVLHFQDITALSLTTNSDRALLLCYNSSNGNARVNRISFRYPWQMQTFSAAVSGFCRVAHPTRRILPLLHLFDHHDSAVRGGADVEVGQVRSMLSLHRIAAEDVLVGVPVSTGRFNRTYTGTWTTAGEKRDVVLKALDETANYDQKLAFWQEGLRMADLLHPQIVRLLAVVDRLRGPLLVLDSAAHGSLPAYMRNQDRPLSLKKLLRFCWQTATALSFLVARSYVHCDIRAENIAVYRPDTVKLTGFDCARCIDQVMIVNRDDIRMDRAPPETANFLVYSFKSDVFMFGLCAWEILNRCRNPPTTNASDQHGISLPCPRECTEQHMAVLRACWAADSEQRPDAADVCTAFHDLHLGRASPMGASRSLVNVHESAKMTDQQANSDQVVRCSSEPQFLKRQFSVDWGQAEDDFAPREDSTAQNRGGSSNEEVSSWPGGGAAVFSVQDAGGVNADGGVHVDEDNAWGRREDGEEQTAADRSNDSLVYDMAHSEGNVLFSLSRDASMAEEEAGAHGDNAEDRFLWQGLSELLTEMERSTMDDGEQGTAQGGHGKEEEEEEEHEREAEVGEEEEEEDGDESDISSEAEEGEEEEEYEQEEDGYEKEQRGDEAEAEPEEEAEVEGAVAEEAQDGRGESEHAAGAGHSSVVVEGDDAGGMADSDGEFKEENDADDVEVKAELSVSKSTGAAGAEDDNAAARREDNRVEEEEEEEEAEAAAVVAAAGEGGRGGENARISSAAAVYSARQRRSLRRRKVNGLEGIEEHEGEVDEGEADDEHAIPVGKHAVVAAYEDEEMVDEPDHGYGHDHQRHAPQPPSMEHAQDYGNLHVELKSPHVEGDWESGDESDEVSEFESAATTDKEGGEADVEASASKKEHAMREEQVEAEAEDTQALEGREGDMPVQGGGTAGSSASQQERDSGEHVVGTAAETSGENEADDEALQQQDEFQQQHTEEQEQALEEAAPTPTPLQPTADECHGDGEHGIQKQDEAAAKGAQLQKEEGGGGDETGTPNRDHIQRLAHEARQDTQNKQEEQPALVEESVAEQTADNSAVAVDTQHPPHAHSLSFSPSTELPDVVVGSEDETIGMKGAKEADEMEGSVSTQQQQQQQQQPEAMTSGTAASSPDATPETAARLGDFQRGSSTLMALASPRPRMRSETDDGYVPEDGSDFGSTTRGTPEVGAIGSHAWTEDDAVYEVDEEEEEEEEEAETEKGGEGVSMTKGRPMRAETERGQRQQRKEPAIPRPGRLAATSMQMTKRAKKDQAKKGAKKSAAGRASGARTKGKRTGPAPKQRSSRQSTADQAETAGDLQRQRQLVRRAQQNARRASSRAAAALASQSTSLKPAGLEDSAFHRRKQYSMRLARSPRTQRRRRPADGGNETGTRSGAGGKLSKRSSSRKKKKRQNATVVSSKVPDTFTQTLGMFAGSIAELRKESQVASRIGCLPLLKRVTMEYARLKSRTKQDIHPPHVSALKMSETQSRVRALADTFNALLRNLRPSATTDGSDDSRLSDTWRQDVLEACQLIETQCTQIQTLLS